MARYEVRMSDWHDCKIISRHNTEDCAIRAVLAHNKAHRHDCECRGAVVWVGAHQMFVVLPDGVPIGCRREELAYLERIDNT